MSGGEYVQPADPERLIEPVDKAGGGDEELTDLIQEVLVLRAQVQEKKNT